MRVIALVLLSVVARGATADETPRWNESVQIFATVANFSDAAIIAEADAALSPLRFHRDSTGTTYPGNLIPGIFASYKAAELAAAMIVQASRPGCIVFSATNYNKGAAGLVDRAGAAIKTRFRVTFGKDVRFFTDPNCTVAL